MTLAVGLQLLYDCFSHYSGTEKVSFLYTLPGHGKAAMRNCDMGSVNTMIDNIQDPIQLVP